MATASETTAIYNAVLQRAPTDAELAAFVSASQTPSAEAQQIDILVNSSEAVTYVYPVVALYQATFGRVPEPGGLNFWVDYFRDATTGDDAISPFDALSTINAGFAASSEFEEDYPGAFEAGVATEEFLNALYQNVLGRAPDEAGMEAFLDQPIAAVLTAFAVSSETISLFDGAIDIFLTKAANSTQDYVGSLLDINDDGVVDENDDITNPDSFTLTEGVDVATANVFEAPRGFTPGGTDQVNTLNDDDVLTGTGTNPTLNFTFVNDADTGDLDINPTLNGIQTINIDVRVGADAELDLQDSSGVQNINIDGVDDSVDFSIDNIQDVAGDGNGLNLSINNSGDDDARVLFQFDTQAVDGSADTVNLTLNDVDVAEVVIDDEDGDAGLGVEMVNLTSTGGSNTVELLTIEDAEQLMIDGDSDLTLGDSTDFTRGGRVEAMIQSAGLGLVAGSLTTVDASALTGDLEINLGDEVTGTLDDTSGVDVNFSLVSGSGNDTIRLLSAFDSSGDTIDAGEGDNTLVVYDSIADGSITNVQSLEVRNQIDTTLSGGASNTITVDASLFTGLEDITVRNEGYDLAGNGDTLESTIELEELTPELAQAITILHSTTDNNDITLNTLVAELAEDTDDDTVAVTIADGVNSDPRFNFELDADSGTTGDDEVENISLADNDTESNTVLLTNFAEHGGTLTLTGGAEDDFFNLDAAELTVTAGESGIYGVDNTGLDDDAAFDNASANDIEDVAYNGAAGATRLKFETIEASESLNDNIVRIDGTDVDGDPLNVTATFGAGDDTVIFEGLGDSRAGLTISDTVDGGEGIDTLVIDGGNVANITLGASEWTNVSNFEAIRLIQNDGATGGNAGDFGDNDYNLRLTDDLIDSNGSDVAGGRSIAIINDNGLVNETAATIGDTDGSAESGVTIDARTLSANRSFTYDGEEGTFETADRFIMADANINGMAMIDGGAVDAAGAANHDVLEVRNSAVITLGDLANIANVGTISFTNDTATTQSSVLQLDNETLDRLVNDFHDAFADDGTDPVETLTINVAGNELVNAPTELTIAEAETIDTNDVIYAISVTGTAAVVINGAGDGVPISGDGGDNNITADDGDNDIDGGAGNDTINGGGGDDTIDGGDGNDVLVGGAGNDDINGGAGNDILGGGAGNDALNGGTGSDEFHFDAGTGSDTIEDFVSGTDVISFLDGGAVTFANSTNDAVVGDSDLAAGDFDTEANLAATDATNDQQVVSISTTSAAALADVSTTGTAAAAWEGYVAVSNGTDGFIYYDADWSDLGGRELIATVTGQAVAFVNADFDVY